MESMVIAMDRIHLVNLRHCGTTEKTPLLGGSKTEGFPRLKQPFLVKNGGFSKVKTAFLGSKTGGFPRNLPLRDIVILLYH